MAIKSMTLLTGATITPTGGTAQTFVPDGVSIPGGVHVADGGQPDFRLREHTTYRTRNPRLVNGKYVKAKRWVSHVIPCTDSDGNGCVIRTDDIGKAIFECKQAGEIGAGGEDEFTIGIHLQGAARAKINCVTCRVGTCIAGQTSAAKAGNRSDWETRIIIIQDSRGIGIGCAI